MRVFHPVRFDETLGIEVKRCANPDCKEKPITDFYSNGAKSFHSKCKECDKAAKKARYAANPEKERAYAREYAKNHPEEHRARYYRWEATHKEYRIQYYRQYNNANRERRRAYDRIRHSKETPEMWREAYKRRRGYFQVYGVVNKTQLRMNEHAWRKNNPEKHADKEQRRRARKRNAPRIDKIDRLAIIERDKWTCYLCKTVCTLKNVTLDHVVPLFHGGTHTADNLRVACRPCNSSKGTRMLRDFLA